MNGWIGVDLDGTLALYERYLEWDKIGPPIPKMVERIKKWLSEGKEVRIFTARIASDGDHCHVTNRWFTRSEIVSVIQDYTEEHVGRRLDVTATKDYLMIELWDDRCVQVIPNTGERADGKA